MVTETREFLLKQIASCEAEAERSDLANVKSRMRDAANAWRRQLETRAFTDQARDRRLAEEAD